VTGDSGWCRYDAAAHRLILSLHVQPGARQSRIAGLHGDALKIKVAAPPVDNKANAALIAFLSETLGVAISAIAIRRGATSRRKMVEITGGPELVAKLGKIE
jgi:uncharacterized protein (TIGR00251 family)